MKYIRTNVYENGGDFSNETLLWYARGVAALQARPITDQTSWSFYAAIHGIDQDLWTQYGYLTPTTTLPPQNEQDLYWNQCQHGSWYFLPWHRGYLLAFEENVREAIIKLGGPSDWALPYWNYFGTNENRLPPAFATQDLPDGEGKNPLFVVQRWGPHNNGNVYVPLSQVNLRALNDPEFTGVSSGGSPGFGGVDTGFSHSNRPHGRLEAQPHDAVHGLVGGADPADPNNLPGLMSDPDTAGLDPIFWLHHANIDRLWEVWLRKPTSTGNPKDADWVNGPPSGQRQFVMPWPPAGTKWVYTPGDMGDLAKLDYVYDDLTPAGPVPAFAAAPERARPAGAAEGAAAMANTGHNVEMVGASEEPLRITGRNEVRTSVRLDTGTRRKVAENLNLAASAAESGAASTGERVFLNIENVRGTADHTVLEVYLNVPDGASPAHYVDWRVDSLGLFGLRKASEPDGEHGGAGLTFVLEITEIIQSLHLDDALQADTLDISIVPFNEAPADAPITVGRVSVFRQGR